jgi:predicted kinase
MTMQRPTLYIFVGYPGAGKTTAAKLIHDKTGATHLWADHERLKMFSHPSHSATENNQLYDYLNALTGSLLKEGKSVIFDTNFNFDRDRKHLSNIAKQNGAITKIIWISTPKDIAKKRAVHDANLRNGYQLLMSEGQFDTIASHLEPPAENEYAVKIDGTELNSEDLLRQLDLS